jgi:lipoprotein-releasing system permease protein
MEFPLKLALRYLGAKKRASVSVGTAFATLGVILGVAALSIVMSVTGGFQEQFRNKVLGVNAHVLVLKYSVDFHEYRDVMKDVEGMSVEYPCIPSPHVLWPLMTKICSDKVHVTGVAPFTIAPMMITHGDRTATGVLLKGVDPERMPKVLDLPKHIMPGGSLEGLRRPGAKPPKRPASSTTSLIDEDAGAGLLLPDHPDQTEPHKDAIPGGRRSLLAEINGEIGDAGLDDTDDAGAPEEVATADTAPTGLTDAGISGSVVPDGGYQSKLPDVDILPDSIDPDPCKNPKEVAALPGAVLGKTLAKQLGVGVGDCVQVTSPTIGVTFGSQTRPPIAKQFRVIAMFDAGFDQYDSKLVYTDLYEAQAFYDQGDSVTGVEMKVDDIDHTKEVVDAIDAKLNNSVYHTMDWMDLNHGLFTALLIQQIGMSVVLALIIVVAAFTVIATLIMVVLDKKKEIALLKAIGMSDFAVLRVFLYQGGLIGFVGTTVGLGLGYICCKFLLAYGFPLDPKVYFISRLPVLIRPNEFVVTGIVSIVICLVATAFPAYYAASLRPADGLRAE